MSPHANSTTPRLDAGSSAPAFAIDDAFGTHVRVPETGRTTLLSFFRNSACALCNLRVHQLIERTADWRARGLDIVVVFESSADAIRASVGTQDAPFPIIADPDARLYDAFGVEVSSAKVEATMEMPETAEMVAAAAAAGFELRKEAGSNFLRMPADFVIAGSGEVLAAHYADFVWDHLPFDVIDALLAPPPAP